MFGGPIAQKTIDLNPIGAEYTSQEQILVGRAEAAPEPKRNAEEVKKEAKEIDVVRSRENGRILSFSHSLVSGPCPYR
jgi:hypothetical protein